MTKARRITYAENNTGWFFTSALILARSRARRSFFCSPVSGGLFYFLIGFSFFRPIYAGRAFAFPR